MAEYRYKIDTVEVDNPLNWQDIEVAYARDPLLAGLFTTYSSKVKWIGSAYDAIQTAISTGVCDELDATIDYRCSKFDAWTNVITGVIVLADVEIDTDDCIIEAPIETGGCIGRFLNSTEDGVDFNSAFSVGGSVAMTSPIEDIFIRMCYTGIDYVANGFAQPYGATAYNLFAFFTKYLTDDCIEFTSDFLTTTHVQQELRFDLTVAPAVLDDVIIELEEDLTGIKYYFRIVWGGLGLEDIGRCMILQEGLPGLVTTEKYINQVVSSYNVTTPGGGVVERIEVVMNSPCTITSVSAGTGTITGSEIVAPVYGGEGIVWTNTDLLLNNKIDELGIAYRSFIDIWEFFRKILDLGMSFEVVAGVTYLRIEPVEYYLDTTSALTIREIVDAKISYNEELLAASVFIGAESQSFAPYNATICPELNGNNKRAFGVRYPLNPDCSSTLDRSVDNDHYHGLGQKNDTMASLTDSLDDQDLMFYMVASGGTFGSPFGGEYFLDAVGFKQGGWIQNFVLYDYNILYFHKYTLPELTLTDYDASILTDTVKREYYDPGGGYQYLVTFASSGDVVIPEGDGYTPRIWEFTRYISKSDFDLISAGQSITINTGSDPSDDVKAFLVDVRHNIDSGETTFIVTSK